MNQKSYAAWVFSMYIAGHYSWSGKHNDRLYFRSALDDLWYWWERLTRMDCVKVRNPESKGAYVRKSRLLIKLYSLWSFTKTFWSNASSGLNPSLSFVNNYYKFSKLQQFIIRTALLSKHFIFVINLASLCKICAMWQCSYRHKFSS